MVLGDQRVGKTCMVLRFIEGFFNPDQQSTVGAFFLTKKIILDSGTSLKMQLWDTAGQERYRAMAPMYYRHAQAAIVCYDPSKEDSLTKCRDWVDELLKNVRDDDAKMVLAIAATKSDLPEKEKIVSRARGEEFAKSVNALFFEASAKADVGVKELFQAVSQEVWARMPDGAAMAAVSNKTIVVGVDEPDEESVSKGCCA